MEYRVPATITTLFLALGVGCSDDGVSPDGPTVASVAGDYAAVEEFGAWEFTTTADGETIDRLAEGAYVEIALNPDGSTAGELFVPEADEDGADFQADLAGTWTLDAGTVTFSHEADTFLRDTPFTADGDRLSGEQTFDGVRVRLELARL